MSKVTFEWHGEKVVTIVEEAARETINETVDAARDDARETHTWKNDPRVRKFAKGSADTDLELQIVSEHDKTPGPHPRAFFGYTKRKGFYGLFHEEGTTHEHEYPALRPAADRQFPTAIARLREKLRGRLR